jgi:hypothetical protein
MSFSSNVEGCVMMRICVTVALVLCATGLAMGEDYLLPPLAAPKWWHTPDMPADGLSRCIYVSFQTNPADMIPPDYVYDGFTPKVADEWSATNDFATVGTVFAKPVVDPLWGDGVGMTLAGGEELSVLMGNYKLPDWVTVDQFWGTEYFVEVVYRAADGTLDNPLELEVTFSQDYGDFGITTAVVEEELVEVITEPDANGWVIQYWKGEIFPHPEWNQFTLIAGEDIELDSMWAGTSPEPSAIVLLIAGAAGMARRRRS